MMKMIKNPGLKMIALLIAVLLSLSCLSVAAFAVTDQDMAQISVAASNTNPTKDETITVTVSIDNYRTMSPRISAMLLSVSFDTACFDYVAGSEKSLLKINNDDLTSVAFDGIDKVSFAYTYANTRKLTLPTTAKEIYSFQLKVKSTVTEKTTANFSVEECTLYNGKSEATYKLIDCKDPKTDVVTAWGSRPGMLLNGSDKNEGTYSGNVVVTFDVSSASLVYEGRGAVSITSPYTCDKNGTYTITVTTNGQRVSQTFTIKKSISSISVKQGTYRTEYALGVTPDYSSWVLLVTYTDGTYSELSMDDKDIEITGFEPGAIGDQRLLVKYKEKTTSVTITVQSKNVIAFDITSPISKTDYLIGDDIDTTGGVLLIRYDDGSSEEVPITKNMLSGYDSTYVGEQNVTVTYSTVSQTFRVTFYPREAVDELIAAIDALDLNTISLESKDQIKELIDKYNSMTTLQKNAVINYQKLEAARERWNEIASRTNDETDTAAPSTTADTAQTTEETGNKGHGNVIWYIVAGIIILSVIGGVGYFLFIYFKRKKEIDEDDEYYDDGDFDDEGDDDGDLSYEDDIINIDDEDDDELRLDEEDKDNE